MHSVLDTVTWCRTLEQTRAGEVEREREREWEWSDASPIRRAVTEASAEVLPNLSGPSPAARAATRLHCVGGERTRKGGGEVEETLSAPGSQWRSHGIWEVWLKCAQGV